MDGLNNLAREIHETARSKGFWEGQQVLTASGMFNVPRPVGDVLALVHSEVSEALEEYRDGHDLNAVRFVHSDGTVCPATSQCRSATGVSDPAKPEGVPIELADIILRVLDACGAWEIDIEEALAYKMNYNSTRQHLHGRSR